MKTKHFLFLSVVILAGCMATDPVYTSLDSYIQNNGVPTSSYDLQNGNKLYFFQTRCNNSWEYKEYNVEVAADNTVVRETVTKRCPTVSNQSNYNSYNYSTPNYYPISGYSSTAFLQQRYDMLNMEYSNLMRQETRISEQWMQSQKTRGATHPDTLALKQQYDELARRSKALKEEMERIRQQFE